LADSSKGVVECVNYAMKELGFSKFEEREIYRTIGLSLEHTFIKLIGENYKDKTKEFKYLFVKRADEIMADLTTLFSDTPSVIKELYTRGIKLGIVSTKFRYRIEAILRRENQLNFFEVIIGGEDVSYLKPYPSGLLLAIKKLDLNPSEVIYIGDSITDSQTADRAGISFIAVLSGVTSQDDFFRFQVDRFLNNISDLPRVLSVK
jgi:phosphoglycolate phosphatase